MSRRSLLPNVGRDLHRDLPLGFDANQGHDKLKRRLADDCDDASEKFPAQYSMMKPMNFEHAGVTAN